MDTPNTSKMNNVVSGVEGLFMGKHSRKGWNGSYQDDSLDDIIEPFKSEIALTRDPLVSHILQGDRESVEHSCRNPSLSKLTDTEGNSVLMVLTQTGRTDLLNSLVSFGVKFVTDSIEQRSNSGATALHHAAVSNKCEAIDWLVLYGADVNAEDSDGRTPVFVSAYEGHAEAVETLVKTEKADVDARDIYGRTALMAAAQQGHMNLVRKLVQLGADVTCTSNSGKTALFYACLQKRASGVIKMITLLQSLGANFYVKDITGLTVLMFATVKGCTEVVQYLLKNCENKDEHNENGQTALHLAASGSHCKALKLLLEAGCDVDAEDERGDTALILSTRKGSMECVQLLLKYKAFIDKQNDAQKTALMEAVVFEQYEIAELLHESGASVYLTCNTGTSAKDLASVSKNMPIRDYFSKLPTHDEVKKFFLAVEKYAFDMVKKATHFVNVRNAAGFTPLMVAAGTGSLPMVKYLCNSGASVNAQTGKGITSLACAVIYGYLKVLDLLIGYGADVNMKNYKGQTLLHKYAEEGHFAAVKTLERIGASLNVKDKIGKTALMIAAQKNHFDIVKYLVNAGAEIDVRSEENVSAAEYAEGNVQAFLQESEREMVRLSENEGPARNLISACREGNEKHVSELINSGAPVNSHDSENNGTTALIEACKVGDYAMVDSLCEAGAKTHVKAQDGATPLHCSSCNGNVKIVTYLLDTQGANANAVDTNGKTPLMCATAYGYEAIVKVLIGHGALVNVGDKTCGLTALDYGFCSGSIQVVQLLLECQHVGDIKGLVDNGPNRIEQAAEEQLQSGDYKMLNALNSLGTLPHRTKMYIVGDEDKSRLAKETYKRNLRHKRKSRLMIEACRKNDDKTINKLYPKYGHVRNERGQTLLMVSIESGSRDAVKYLVEKCVNVNDVDKDRDSALKLAVGEGHNDIVKDLLGHRADPNITDKKGRTPLHRAARVNNLTAAKLLTEHEADIHIKDNGGFTPLEVSSEWSPEITKLLHELKKEGNKDVQQCTNHQEVKGFVKENAMQERKVLTYEVRKAMQIPRRELELEKLIRGTQFWKGLYRDTPVAVKTFSRIPKGEQLKRAAFFNEVKLCEPLLHDNIVRLLGHSQEEHGTNECSYYIAYEFVDGMDLHKLIFERPKFERSRNLSVATQCYRGLAYLHKEGLIHGYLEPSSIMVSSGIWMVKISDFKMITRCGAKSTSPHHTGTVSYRAPELMLRNESPTKYSDIWAMGIIICELYTHEKFWRSTNENDLKKEMKAENSVEPLIENICRQFNFDEVKLVCGSLQIEATIRPLAKFFAVELAKMCKLVNPF